MRVTSFRMVDSQVRNLQGHWERLGLSPSLQHSVRARLREFGPEPCFPQVSASGEVQYRPDRPFSELVSVDPVPHLDCRSTPTIKGPDMPLLAKHMRVSQGRGYAEGLLVDSEGFLVEGIFSALIVFTPDGPVVPEHPSQLPSTTLAQVTEFFGGLSRQPLKAEGHPMWLLNAFSGVRTTSTDFPVAEVNQWLWDQAETV